MCEERKCKKKKKDDVPSRSYGLAVETDNYTASSARGWHYNEVMHRMVQEDLEENCPGPGRQACDLIKGAVDAAVME